MSYSRVRIGIHCERDSRSKIRAALVTTALFALSAGYCCRPVGGFARSAPSAPVAGRATGGRSLSLIVTSSSPLLRQGRGRLKRTRDSATACLQQHHSLDHQPGPNDHIRRWRRSFFTAASTRAFFTEIIPRKQISLAATPPSDDSGSNDTPGDRPVNRVSSQPGSEIGAGAGALSNPGTNGRMKGSESGAGLGLGDGQASARASASEEGGAGVKIEAGRVAAAKQPPKAKWEPPKWAANVHPGLQAAASVSLYLFHMLVLSKSGITFPIQLIPNNHGLTQSVGLDTAAGFAVLAATGWARLISGMPLLPPLTSDGVPWGWNKDQVKKRLPLTFVVLIVAYLLSGWGSQLCEYFLYILSFAGINMSVAMHRSAQVLMSHMVWVLMGVRILGFALRPFFNRKKGSWVGMKWKANWLWWVTGGYFVSSALFNMADLANQFVCPLPPDTESVVVKIINPENNDVAAMAVGSIAPCMSAPWWEEVLYRGFLLPALTLYLPLKGAVPAGSLLFAAHHMNLQAMLPLSVLGLVWSLLYIYSGNLLVTVLIHAMWNSRVFLGSLLGL